jgi:hypothetical protein
LEAAKAWGVDKDIVKEIANMLKKQFGSEAKTTDNFGANASISGSFGLGWGGGKGGSGVVPWKAGIGADVGIEWSSTDSLTKTAAAYLTQDQKETLVDKFIQSLQNKSGQRSSDSQAKRVEQSYTEGKDVSEEASKSKVYEVAESFGKKAGEMLTYADRLQASLRQDPLNYYAQQKYKEALAAGKSEGEAVRYAMEEVAKLRSNPEALEQWLNEFAKGQGIRSPNVDEKKLEGVKDEVPTPEKVQKEGKQLQEEVNRQIDNTQEELSRRKKELKNYSTPKAQLFNLQAPELELKFDPNNPKFKAYERQVQEWLEGQTLPPIRLLNNVKDTAIRGGVQAGQFVINLGKEVINNIEAWDKAAKEIDSKYGNIRYKP